MRPMRVFAEKYITVNPEPPKERTGATASAARLFFAASVQGQKAKKRFHALSQGKRKRRQA